MRRLTVEIIGGTAAEQADCLRNVAWTVENITDREMEVCTPTESDILRAKYTVVEMADYDHKKLADAWYAGTGKVSRSVNALSRATDIEVERLRHILLGEKHATVKELETICDELAVSLESLSSSESGE